MASHRGPLRRRQATLGLKKPADKRPLRIPYEGTSRRCAWWDQSGSCNKPPEWHACKNEGLCDLHDRMFYHLINQDPR